MAMTQDVRDVLRKVRDEILTGPEKWWKKGHNTAGETTCLMLALNDAAPRMLLEQVYRHLGFRFFWDVVRWNDAPERTFADVRALLDKALNEEPI